MPRIDPVPAPYAPETAHALTKWMPPEVAHEPLQLFRVLERNEDLASRMRVLGSGLLGRGRLPVLDREVIIARVCARCGCRYEWGVHAAIYAGQAGMTAELLHATVTGDAEALVWTPRQRALVRAVDELHDSARLSEENWGALAVHYDAAQMLELLTLAGWYRTISYLANGLLLDVESWAAPVPPHKAWIDTSDGADPVREAWT